LKLIYLWIEDYLNFKQENILFSQDFEINFNEMKLTIKRKQKSTSIFNEKVKNITALIGKNGAGKTNILDLLGSKRRGRSNMNGKYFMIYHLDNDRYIIEGNCFLLIENSILKNPGKGNISETFSIIVEVYLGKIIFRDFLNQSEYKDQLNYLSVRNKFDGYLYKMDSLKIEKEHSVLFNRVCLEQKNIGYSAIYNMTLKL